MPQRNHRTWRLTFTFEGTDVVLLDYHLPHLGGGEVGAGRRSDSHFGLAAEDTGHVHYGGESEDIACGEDAAGLDDTTTLEPVPSTTRKLEPPR